MKKFLFVNYKWVIAILLASNMVMVPAFVHAQNQVDVWGDEITDTGGKGLTYFQDIGLGNRDPRKIASSVVQVMLGFLGVIAVVLILFGGFKWMTAMGNEDKVDEAKKLISYGVVGLLIVLAAFAVSVFVLNALLGSTGAQSTPIEQPN